MIILSLNFCVPIAVSSDDSALSVRGRDLFELVTKYSSPVPEVPKEIAEVESSVRVEVVKYFVINGVSENPYTFQCLVTLDDPGSRPYLKCLCVQNLLSKDSLISSYCLMTLSQIDREAAGVAALIVLSNGKKSVYPLAATILLASVDEARWAVLRRIYARTKENKDFDAFNNILENSQITKEWSMRSK